MTASSGVYSQADTTIYKVKLDKYNSMKNKGKIWSITGGTALLIGAGLGVGFLNHAIRPNNGYAYGGMVAGGVIGIGLLTPGIILNSRAKRKIKETQILLNDARVGLFIAPKQVGFTIVFRL